MMRVSLPRRPLVAANALSRALARKQPPQSAPLSFLSYRGTNTIFPTVQTPSDLHAYQVVAAMARQPLITLWGAQHHPVSRSVDVLVQSLVRRRVGQAEGGVVLVSVDCYARDIVDDALWMAYMINGLPTLLTFGGGEAQHRSRIDDLTQLTNPKFLSLWIRSEARRYYNRGGDDSKITFRGALGHLDK